MALTHHANINSSTSPTYFLLRNIWENQQNVCYISENKNDTTKLTIGMSSNNIQGLKADKSMFNKL